MTLPTTLSYSIATKITSDFATERMVDGHVTIKNAQNVGALIEGMPAEAAA
jgi:hypothetical protein